MSDVPKNRLMGLLSTKRVNVTRTCRYGHGLLDKATRSWALVNHLRPGETDPLGFQAGELHYRCSVWVCPACGYMELSDSED